MKSSKKKHILMWALTIFMGITVIAFFPSISSIIALIFVAIAAPIGPLQKFLSERGLRGFTKGAVLCVAFVGTMLTVPTNSTSTADTPTRGTLPSAAVTQESAEPVQTPEPTLKPTPTPEPTATPTPEPTAEAAPTPAPTPEPTSAPTPQPTPEPTTGGSQVEGNGGNGNNFTTWDNPDQQNTSQTWVLNTHTMKIHYPSCGSVARIAPQNYATSNAPESELLARGYTRCGQCH